MKSVNSVEIIFSDDCHNNVSSESKREKVCRTESIYSKTKFSKGDEAQ